MSENETSDPTAPAGTGSRYAETIDSPASADAQHAATATHCHGDTPTRAAPRIPEQARLGEYDVLGEIARGGMGVVYRARHRQLGRVVALKVTRTGPLASDEERKRFQAEVEAAGQLDHPNIVPVYETGEADGCRYFSMALVEGPSLADRIADGPLSPREAATVIRQAAAAVAYAHGHGVVHRDLKPGNILIDPAGQPRITDFGLAKRTNADSSLTQIGQVMGTPQFMPPEQAEGRNEQVGPLADVYSLGATLYCLLTGRPPFQAATVVDTLKQVVEREPVAPRLLNPAVDRDLDTICLKCLQKRSERRYESAAALGEDLQRFLDRRPIFARPVGIAEKAVRWCRRNPALAGAAGSVVVVVLAAFALISDSYFRAERAREHEAVARQEAERKEKSERWERYRSNLTAASSAMRLHNVAAARDALGAAPEEHRGWEWRHFYHQLDQSTTNLSTDHPVGNAYVSYDRSTLATLATDATRMYFWDVAGRKFLAEMPIEDIFVYWGLSRDGRTAAFARKNHVIDIRDVPSGRLRTTLRGAVKPITFVHFTPDGSEVVAAAADHVIRVWDAATGEQRAALQSVDALAVDSISPDGRRLITHGGVDRKADVWDRNVGRIAFTLAGHEHDVNNAEFNATGDRIATAESFPGNAVRLWDAKDGRLLATLRGHTNGLFQLRFSPDGRRLVTASYDQTARLWDAVTGQPIATLSGHNGWVYDAVFSPDGSRVATASQDQTVRLWDGATGAPLATLHGHTADAFRLVFSPDGTAIVSVAKDANARATMRWWDVAQAERSGAIRGHANFVYGVVSLPDGERVASASWDGTVRVWHASTGRQLAAFDYPEKAAVTSVAAHPDGKHVAALGRADVVCLWDLDTGREVHRFPLPSKYWRDSRVAFSRDGKRMAAGGADHAVRVWDVDSRTEVAVLKGHTDFVRDVAFAVDGSWLATAGEFGDKTVRIWNLGTKETVRVLTGHTDCVYALSVSPDGRWLASGSMDGAVRIWDTASWAEAAVLTQGTNVYGLSFSPDGKRLAAACANNTIRLWDVGTHKAVGELHGHSAYVHQVAFSPDGSRLVSASGDTTLRVWDTVPAGSRTAARR